MTVDEIEGLHFRFADIAIDSASRIVAFGTAEDLSVSLHIPFYPVGAWVHPTFAVVLRFDAAGRLDPSFGGDGIVRTDLGLPRTVRADDGSTLPLVRGVSGNVDSQNRPLLLAGSAELEGLERGERLVSPARVVARLSVTGDLDPSFGTGGLTVLSSAENRGLAVGSGSEHLLAWGGSLLSPAITQVTRLNADGTVDGAYGTAGVRSIHGDASGGAAVVDRAGRLLVLDAPANFGVFEPRNGATPAHLLRLKADGSLDRSFGRAGVATVRLPWKRAALSSIAVDAGGRVLLAGAAMRPRTATTGFEEPRELFVVGRLRSSGRLDRSFGHHGWLKTGFGRRTKLGGARRLPPSESPSGDWGINGPETALDARGRLVVADAGHSPQLEPGGVILARYLLGR